MITAFFRGYLIELLPYMKCLLYGYNSLNNLCASGDQSFSINTESCCRMHRLLERIGRAYSSGLVRILSAARTVGLIRNVIDLSMDGFHMPYDGEKRVKDWGTPFNTMMNRAYPGLYPLTGVDMLSNLILYAGSFVRAGAKEWKKRLGNIVAPNVMVCINLLGRAGIRVRSLITDEGIASHRLMSELVSSSMEYIFALKSNSRLKRLDARKGRLIGILRGVEYYGERTNLIIIIKDAQRRYLYISSFTKGARYVWKRFCRRGNHERKHGVASTMGIKSMPSSRLFQIKGHILTCIYLNLILKALCRELNLGNVDVETFRSIFTRQCYVRWESDGRSTHAIIVASKALLRKLGDKHTITWANGTIQFIYYRESNAPKITVKL